MTVGLWKRRLGRKQAVLPPPPPPARDPGTPAQPEFLAAMPAVRASLGADAVVSGRLSFSEPTRIDGTLRGEVRASDLLIIGETGFVEGTVRAASLVILGQLEGHVVSADRVEIGPRGALHGTVEARTLVVCEGGRLDGDCRVVPARGRVHVLHPRSLPAGE